MRALTAMLSLATGLLAAGCVADDPGVLAMPGVTVAEGFAIDLVTDDFDRPTQVAIAPNGDLLVAELAGEENAGSGRIVRLSLDRPEERSVVQAGLDKPTGIAIVGETLWIMERQSLSFTDLAPDAERTVVFDELPFNGRSEGSLTVTPNGGLLFDTSGRKSGSVVADGSAELLRLDGADPIATGGGVGEPTVVASGLKHAYGHTFGPDGRLWSTEMSDGSFDGEPASDELLEVSDGDDFGWPACVGDNRPVLEFGGDGERCGRAPPSHALFGPGATPTAVEVAPWDTEQLVIALWVDDQIVTVPTADRPVSGPWPGEAVVTGIESPQDLVIDGNRLLIVDHLGGRILSLRRA